MRRYLQVMVAMGACVAMPVQLYADEVDQAANVDEAAGDAADEAAEVIEIVDAPPPGAHTKVTTEDLERHESDDLHRALATVPGVYIRQEDGYGLRPNIGMRGANSDRSSKIALHEDGVLIGPAPYSAPAAYYLPMVTRLGAIEVTKGPAGLIYGPNTVGGAVNMLSPAMPGERAALVDLALGSDWYGKSHARLTERRERWGLQAEYVHLQANGFKELDGGGNTGFAKDDAQLWGRVNSTPSATRYHQLDLKVGWSREDSNETYLGLAPADFAATPRRRYVATKNDHMAWDHWRWRLAWRHEVGTALRVSVDAYRHDFSRAWGKVDGFGAERDLSAVLADPQAGSNALYYGILTGAIDSTAPEEELIYGINDRSFVSQGVQAAARMRTTTGSLAHVIDVGARLHYDHADRRRYEETFAMQAGDLVRSGRPTATVLDARGKVLAFSAYAKDELTRGAWGLDIGSRLEVIDNSYVDRLTDKAADDAYVVLIPGAAVRYKPPGADGRLELLAGVHRGFAPVVPAAAAPGANAPAVKPEASVNVETGGRMHGAWWQASLIGFYSNYTNLVGTCTFASGCLAQQEGAQFSGGAARVFGLEAQANAAFTSGAGWRVPVAAAYTFTSSEFLTSFTSGFAQWGVVGKGDELPYLPEHQLALDVAFEMGRLSLGTQLKWQAAMRDEAGQGVIAEAQRISISTMVDANVHVQVTKRARFYATASNVLNEQVVAARRPYGIRPSAPRLFVLGAKLTF